MNHLGERDYILCACGAKLISDNLELISNFDKVHGSTEHVNLLLEIRMLKNDKRRVKYIYKPEDSELTE